MTIGAILGSAYGITAVAELGLTPLPVSTALGEVVLFVTADREGVVLFRHGVPHRFLPNQIPYRAHALALQAAGVQALLVTSSVGLIDPDLALHRPYLVEDLLMPENRLPDGSACTLHEHPAAGQGHLVLDEGLLSRALSAQVEHLLADQGWPAARRVVFGYAQGPRSKSAAENRLWRLLGAQVNSMTLAPEVVLANELEIPCAALVVGHKYSIPGQAQSLQCEAIAATLDTGKQIFDRVVLAFLRRAHRVPFGNRIYRY